MATKKKTTAEPKSEIKRYNPPLTSPDCMHPNDAGEYVRYDDHAAEVERLRAELHRVALPHHDMHLRDRLAEKAIQGLLANPSGPIQANGMSGWGLCNCTIEQVADFAWHIADHMLKARGGSDAG